MTAATSPTHPPPSEIGSVRIVVISFRNIAKKADILLLGYINTTNFQILKCHREIHFCPNRGKERLAVETYSEKFCCQKEQSHVIKMPQSPKGPFFFLPKIRVKCT